MSELIPVNILVADRTYRLKIDGADEEMVRKTAGLINDKITEFKTHFAGKDMQDYVAMVLLWFATDQVARMKAGLASENMEGQLDLIEQLLDNQLKTS